MPTARRTCSSLPSHELRIADGGAVSDDTWANVTMLFDEDQIAALVSQIVIINAFNRMNVMLGRPGGDYRVGQFG